MILQSVKKQNPVPKKPEGQAPKARASKPRSWERAADEAVDGVTLSAIPLITSAVAGLVAASHFGPAAGEMAALGTGMVTSVGLGALQHFDGEHPVKGAFLGLLGTAGTLVSLRTGNITGMVASVGAAGLSAGIAAKSLDGGLSQFFDLYKK